MIAPVGGATSAAALATTATATTAAPGFGDALTQAVSRVDGMQGKADDALAALASGQEVDLHGAMIALEQADIGIRTMASVRDKLVGAYQQVMNMAI